MINAQLLFMEPSNVSQFFAAWEHQPDFCLPPEDPSLKQRIVKLAEFASRNGPHFVDLLRDKQKGNPEYSFLFGGEGSEYYRFERLEYESLPNGVPELSDSLQGTV